MKISSWGRSPVPAVVALASSIAVAAITITGVGQPTTRTGATTGAEATGTMPMGMAGMSMPASAASNPAAANPVATNTVAIQNFAFMPASITVKAGTTVTWTNQDQDPHTVTSTNNGPLASPPLNTGQSFHYTFNTPGRYDYLCTIHPFMTATVVVTP